jgi:uncharacterized protein (TIGR01777 family)
MDVSGKTRLKIAISGGSGFIGTHVLQHFIDQQNELILISRTKQACLDGVRCLTWDQLEQNHSSFEHLDAWINLAGETINQRWSDSAKERIMYSRQTAVQRIVKLIDLLQDKPKVVINVSAIAIYGTSATQINTEKTSTNPHDFLSTVVNQWEQAIDLLQGTRVIKLRTGLVLGTDGGALGAMVMPYRFGMGGRIGKGTQWVSWIHIDDIVRLIDFCIHHNEITGIVNATAPNSVTMDQFGRTIAKVLHRPHLFPVPSFVLKLLFGEMSMLILEGQRVTPQVAIDYGFTFKYSRLEEALEQLLSKKSN